METPLTDQPEMETDFKGRSISFYHPNGRGTGSALRLEPRINRNDRDRYNCFFLEMAPQKSAPKREGGTLVPATFDWSAKITVKMNFNDIAEMLTVLEGRAAQVGGERQGLYHAHGNGNTLITFQRQKEGAGYFFALSGKRGPDQPPRKVAISLSEVEATGLRCLLQTGLFFVTFSSLMRGRA